MESLWVLILLLVAISTIVTVRLFRNGAQEEAAAAFETLAPAETPAARRTRPGARARAASAAADSAAAAAPATAPVAAAAPPTRGRRRAPSTTPPPAVWPGGDCPNCGSPTVPSAKFCGECGQRLMP